MDFELSEEHRMLKDLAQKFVRDELMPLESRVLEREAQGKGVGLTQEEREKIDVVSKRLGLWGLDAPEDVGGSDLPQVALVAVNEALGRALLVEVQAFRLDALLALLEQTDPERPGA